ncbi:coiled-coil domain-containing protein 160 homolog [Saccoglossus kowalevskii]|uniref:Myosin heavy chain, skeletal muscle, adult-like n=1 Tax=Saccoglossus kowalevskii TaxID=10224 RepID=A0ABM0GUP4_SACKO|nr:PREDICTED: myosin heavy chain, skeletal muscle, adult-like [Saccoglossus kowalevskii]
MDKHWVEDVFPPYYTYSTEEIHAKYEKQSPPTSKVKALYEKVRQEIAKEENDLQQKAVQAGDTLAEYFEKEDSKLVELEKSCLWSHKELETLREAFKSAKCDNFKLAGKWSVASKQVKELDSKCKKQAHIIESTSKKLHASEQECKRLAIHQKQLQREVTTRVGEVKMLRGEIAELKQERLKMRKKIKEMRKVLTEEKMNRQDAQIELEEKGKNYELQRIVREDGIRLEYQAEINRLYEEINNLTLELEKERLSHTIDNKGLDHLRNHFASLSVQHSSKKDELRVLDTTPF